MIVVINRKTQKKEEEKVYGEKALHFLYKETLISKILRNFVSQSPLVSSLYGYFQKLPFSKKKILPFIKKYHINTDEFLDDVTSFNSFNDFFIRKLKPSARPIDKNPAFAAIPADGRFRFFQNLKLETELLVKGKHLSLPNLLQDESLAKKYVGGSAVLGRLCPVDYHRFHFPTDGIPGKTKFINGPLFSVNPLAVLKNPSYLFENKRTLTLIETTHFGTIAYLEIGATNVGTIHETFTPNVFIKKGAEKGYFSFGGSALILLFEKDKISFTPDLTKATRSGFEILCQMGEEMGVAK